MKHLFSKSGWLVMAAALTIGMASCSVDETTVEAPQPAPQPAAQSGLVQITVGAGIGGGETRSQVEYNATTKERKLLFTAGDKLYVRAIISYAHDDNFDGPYEENTHDAKIMAGFLSIDADSFDPANPTKAKFTGSLQVYETEVVPIYEEVWSDELEKNVPNYDNVISYGLEFSPSTHEFATDDPLGECEYTDAQLVHEGSEELFSLNEFMHYGYYDRVLAENANALMTSTYYVSGAYDPSEKKFWLYGQYAILNCTVSGLTAGADYSVAMYGGNDPSCSEYFNTYKGYATANSSGIATFVLATDPDDEPYYYKLTLFSKEDKKQIELGKKAVERKVYNVTAAATDFPLPAGVPIVCGTTAFPCDPTPGLGTYEVNESPADLFISGTSTGCNFILNTDGGTVTLVSLTATTNDDIIFVECANGDVSLELSGSNVINCGSAWVGLNFFGKLKLSCNGASATLTITSGSTDHKGIYAENHDEEDEFNNPSVLAAPGYTVTCSAATAGPDSDADGDPDYYTWTYTVTKN